MLMKRKEQGEEMVVTMVPQQMVAIQLAEEEWALAAMAMGVAQRSTASMALPPSYL